jgi:hypothetical protein
VNANLFMAAFWVVMAIIVLTVWPSADENDAMGLSPDKRILVSAFTVMLVGYNIVRWRLARVRQQAQEQARAMEQVVRSRRRHDEPRNPDFDFSEREREPDDGEGRPDEAR